MKAISRAAAWTGAALLLFTATGSAQQVDPASPQVIRAELDRLRQEFEALQQQYGDRFAQLEARLRTLEGAGVPAAVPPPVQPPPTQPPPAQPTPAQPPPAPATPAQPTEAAVPPGAAGAGGPTGSLPVYGSPSLLSKIFNPDIAVIGDFLGAAGKNDVAPVPALDMHEAEASFQAIVDPYARADFFFAFGPEGVEIEEGFITFPTLPGDLSMKVGKLRTAFGKVDGTHNHLLPWTERPLVTENLVGGEEGLADAGISVARLITNPWIFLEATGEVYNGSTSVFTSSKRGDVAFVGHVRGYRDLTESTNLDLGTSVAWGRNDVAPGASTRLVGVDATFRYRPLRRAIYRRLLARTELIWSRREGEADAANAFGAYVSTDYQFARRWFAGVRADYSERAFDASLKDKGASLLLTFWPSEFSQLRGQYRRTRYAEGTTANEFLFQFLFSIGAHGAHVF